MRNKQTKLAKEFLPMTINPDFESIPEQMKKLPRWLCWQLQPAEPKAQKVPMTPQNGRLVKASVTDPENWLTFDEAISYFNHGLCSGIGFALTDTSPKVCCVDVDHCFCADGSLTSEAQAIIEICKNSFVEKSQSGTGIHVWFIDDQFAGGRRKGNVEIYAAGRYIAMTGVRVLNSSEELLTVNGACCEAVKKFVDANNEDSPFIPPKAETKFVTSSNTPLSETDRKLIEYLQSEKCRERDSKAHLLFAGKLDEYFKNAGKPYDDSVADYDLFLKILYYSGGEGTNADIAQRALNIFNQSELAKREKWLSREDYRMRTLEAAFKFWVNAGRKNSADRRADSKPAAPMDADYKATTRQFVPDCPVDLNIPDEFTFDDDGICFIYRKKKSTDYIPVTANPIVVTKIFCEDSTSNTKYEVAIKRRGKWQRITYDGRTLQDKTRVIDLADKGALIEDAPRLAKFFARFIKANEFALDETKIFTKPGWQDDGTFIFPAGGENYVCRRNGIDYEDLFSSRGDSEQWKKKFNEVIGTGAQGSLKRGVIGAALAAPLLKVIGVPNFCLHVEGRYSSAKTPLVKFALSAFGNPTEGKLLRSWDSSAKNRTTLAAGLCDFPQGLDELETLGKRGEEDLAKNFYDFTQGIVNQTNKRNGDAKVAESFRGVRLSTGERPPLKQTDKGGAYKRVMSFRAKEPLFDNTFARNLHIFCGKNYGHFGRIWTDYICTHRAEIVADFNGILDALDRSTRIDTGIYETTHIFAIAACETAFYHFRKALSMDNKFEFEIAVVDAQKLIVELPTRDDISDTKRGVELLSSWVAEHPKNFISYGEQSDTAISATSFTETSGILFADGRVGFFPNALRRIVEDELKLSSCQKLINELFDDGKLDTKASDKKRCIRIGGVPRKIYLFKTGVLIPNDDDTEDSANVA